MSLQLIFGALLIMFMRICDVTFGTFRTILVVQGKKYYAAMTGFMEVLIWIFAMRYIVQHMDHTINLFGYATGYALGNILGITLEQKVALGYSQINIVSLHHTDKIADRLRLENFGVTILPAEGSAGGVSILMVIVKRKYQKKVMEIAESVDKKSFITIQQSVPYRGYVHGGSRV
jgi:uncharacterized protein YebE (UPF0316 family)